MTNRMAIKRALNAEGIEHFGGWVEAKEIPKLKSLSAKTAETVKRIKGEIDDNGKSDN